MESIRFVHQLADLRQIIIANTAPFCKHRLPVPNGRSPCAIDFSNGIGWKFIGSARQLSDKHTHRQ